ncbi:MAG: hypothetical protein ACT4PU_11590 [Planctomycetota bacterium]
MLKMVVIFSSVLSLSLGCSSRSPEELPEVVASAELPASDSWQVHLVTDGCFGDRAYDLDLRGGVQPLVSVTMSSGLWSEESQQFTERQRSPTVEGRLTQADLLGLEKLLNYYRAGPGDGCSDTDYITVTRMWNGQAIAREHFVDRSCGAGDVEGVITFQDIIERLEIPE